MSLDQKPVHSEADPELAAEPERLDTSRDAGSNLELELPGTAASVDPPREHIDPPVVENDPLA
ncbi:MAG: hypothetical protein ABIP42_12165, partial [Planctomycetota bacterium]